MFEDNRSPVQLSTQCPHCQTPLQADVGALQRSKGWARCGRCHYLFDAVAHTGIPTLAPISSGFSDDTPTATPQAPGTRQAVAQMPDDVVPEPIGQAHTQDEPAAFAAQSTNGSVITSELGLKAEPDQSRVREATAAPRAQPAWPSGVNAELTSEQVLPSKVSPAARDLPEVPGSWHALSQALDDAIPAKQEIGSQAAAASGNNAASNSEAQRVSASDVLGSLPQMHDQSAQDSNAMTQSEHGLLGSPVAASELVAEPAPPYLGRDESVDDGGRSGGGMSWLTLLLAFVLLLLLGAQLAYLQRDWLVARIPQLQPVAQQVCQRLGCTIKPVQDISQMRILSSSVMRLYSGELQLDITLENKGALQLGVPNIDVLLTDGTDQVFVTHKVTPSDWPQVLERLEAKSRFSITVRWPTNDADAMRMVGYRTQLSYD